MSDEIWEHKKGKIWQLVRLLEEQLRAERYSNTLLRIRLRKYEHSPQHSGNGISFETAADICEQYGCHLLSIEINTDEVTTDDMPIITFRVYPTAQWRRNEFFVAIKSAWSFADVKVVAESWR